MRLEYPSWQPETIQRLQIYAHRSYSAERLELARHVYMKRTPMIGREIYASPGSGPVILM